MGRILLRYTCLVLLCLGVAVTAFAAGPGQGSVNRASSVPLLAVLQMPITPDFALNLSAQAMTVTRGQSSTLNVQASDSNGFDGVINLSCSGMPSGVTCAFTPTTLESNTMAATLTVTAATVVNPYRQTTTNPMGAFVLSGLGLIGMLMPMRRKPGADRPRGQWRWRICGAMLLLGLTVAAMGCGYTSKSMTAPVGTKNVMVTGVSGTLVHSVPFSLTVN